MPYLVFGGSLFCASPILTRCCLNAACTSLDPSTEFMSHIIPILLAHNLCGTIQRSCLSTRGGSNAWTKGAGQIFEEYGDGTIFSCSRKCIRHNVTTADHIFIHKSFFFPSNCPPPPSPSPSPSSRSLPFVCIAGIRAGTRDCCANKPKSPSGLSLQKISSPPPKLPPPSSRPLRCPWPRARSRRAPAPRSGAAWRPRPACGAPCGGRGARGAAGACGCAASGGRCARRRW
jgi:hypothetical protein